MSYLGSCCKDLVQVSILILRVEFTLLVAHREKRRPYGYVNFKHSCRTEMCRLQERVYISGLYF